MAMAKEDRAEILHLVRECNSHKNRLMGIAREIELRSSKKAAGLNSAIGRLETWQYKTIRSIE